jgi:hypothetical protein
MTSPTYAQNKVHIYTYRLNNLDKVRAIDNKSKRRKYAWTKIQKEFLNILINYNY